nr:CCA tRNA nucleotidyltransferase [Nitrospinaceae bacterium]NIS84193.1 CCA tRNA nucleotidyltransferase [Nitrospinaceae bacterium]NIU43289.1 CCA tRNA nucleotidyltransferase [Nitrospinaceae bacterium]NIW58064.1 hypothetical protein [Nitrospinaceae bacterium]
MDKSLKPLLKKLEDSASDLEISLYVVGGGLRNHWLDKPCTDLDFTCRGVTQLARRFAERIRRPCITLDDTPGRETLRVVVHKDSNFDFTELQGKTIEEDLAQRDFTINAMAQPLSGFLAGRTEYHDPHGGRRDLEKRLIRANPGPVLRADPLRLLRAFRFAATLGFEIEADTLAQITRFKEGINRVAVERILHELIL